MDLMQLQYFKIIAETESLTRAAKILHVSQPAMSAMLKKLEEELGVRWFCVPRFSVACPEIQLKDDLYDGNQAAELLAERVYDLIVTPGPVSDSRIQSLPLLRDQVYLSVPKGSSLSDRTAISLREIPAQPLLYPQIGGYFLSQMERVITEEHLPVTLVKNNFNITQHLVRTTNFLATVSTLSIELRNDGTHRTLIPFSDPEMTVLYYSSFLKSGREKVKDFLHWGSQYKACDNGR